ncbi:pilus assembly protein TadG [Bradyrhizobium diazoefficiens]|jgi:Flp pilus assembly protein TadG|nr:pilus assembly protein [Bradyrhizobium diazoefficiens]MBR0968126.1 pilus assembly protein TadG [Bradyrhizobium diazoefficiens]MBR0981523.1 pilus assembly protein TadG [Bradyrhizobium diazoefficiens]MBR1010976.1 pilus assembly protein TadG [Bradyrhizobium diazoefficiens]MBR1017476.1 pilus assembly protein TadG [Bradyrhizobium diazoefficiens]MBR1054873.1 pilus assembly protein TadG [Bradyrhizobium diazoefficiens]
MFRLPVADRIGRQFARFAGADQGNIAVIFAIALVPLLSFVGAAVDYSRAVQARTSMQAALDSTALMLSKDLSSGTITTSQISTQAQAYFNALFTANNAVPTVSVAATYTASTSMGSTIQVTGSGTYTTSFMKIAGFPTLDIGTTSTSAWGMVRMRVAMVLDVTGSMADDGKMPAMQTAAKNLVDQLSALAKSDGDVYISVVPFSKDVNAGSSNYAQSWIDWSDWDAANGTCSNNNYSKQSSCVSAGRTWTPKNHNTWNGCITDRNQDYDIKNTTPTSANSSTLFPAEQYSYCNSGSSAYIQPIMPLSYDWASLKTLIGSLAPTGNTNQGIGLAWGWMTLSTGAPMNAPAKDANYTYKDAIVLLSDGLNTQNRWYSNASQIDARQKKLCDSAKAANITVYTVQVNTGGDPTSSVLQYCASSTDKFYLVTSASQTVSVFKDIGTSLSKLRVAR